MRSCFFDRKQKRLPASCGQIAGFFVHFFEMRGAAGGGGAELGAWRGAGCGDMLGVRLTWNAATRRVHAWRRRSGGGGAGASLARGAAPHVARRGGVDPSVKLVPIANLMEMEVLDLHDSVVLCIADMVEEYFGYRDDYVIKGLVDGEPLKLPTCLLYRPNIGDANVEAALAALKSELSV